MAVAYSVDVGKFAVKKHLLNDVHYTYIHEANL